MQLLDTYLKAVARFLPAAERDDIARELSENLRSQIEDREAQINRPRPHPGAAPTPGAAVARGDAQISE